MRRKSRLYGGFDKNYEKDKDEFLQKLKDFHQAKGIFLGRAPTFGGQVLDLYALYNTVTSFGGISIVTDKKKWGQVFTALGFPPCTNAAFALRQHYTRYLESYEKIFFLGEDDETTDTSVLLRSNANTFKYRRLNKAPKLGTLGEPQIQNFNGIMYSLQSGLENEVNFALNICSLLSNVTNSIFNLAKSANILDLILAQIGVWSRGDKITPDLYKEWYRGRLDDGYVKFWLDVLRNKVAKDMYLEIIVDADISCDNYMDEKDTKLLNKEDGKRTNESKISRVNQVTLILYNFSFEQINAMFLALHDGALRFLLMAGSSKYNNVCRNALEAVDNISEHITLRGVEDSFVQQIMELLHSWISSTDKFKRGRGMAILGKLASREENCKSLVDFLTMNWYKKLVETLCLPDISLILSCMDALYTLSALCERTATSIASVHGSIRTLVCMVTIRAESYGNDAIKGYRIIENKNSIFTTKNQNWLKAQEQQRRRFLEQQQHAQPPRHMMHLAHSGYSRYPNSSPYPQNRIPPHPLPHPPPHPLPHMMTHPATSQSPYPVNHPHPTQHPRLPQQHPTMQVLPPGPSIPPHTYPRPQLDNQVMPQQPPPAPSIPEVVTRTESQESVGNSQLEAHPVFSQPKTNEASYCQSPQPLQATKQGPSAPIRPIPKLPVPSKAVQQSPSYTPQIQLSSSSTELVELDAEIFTAHWISAFYEPSPESQVFVEAIYQDYCQACTKMEREGVLSASQFQSLLGAVLPSNMTKLIKEGKEVIGGIKRRENPIIIQNKIPKAVHEQLLKNKPNFTSKSHEEKVSKLIQKDSPSQHNIEQNDSDKDSKTTTNFQQFDPMSIPHYQHILQNKNMDVKADCLEIIEKIKVESQVHFMQFHSHRQCIQQVQHQLQQLLSQHQSAEQIPANVMNDIQARVQNHHTQMQFHYGKLQSLSLLSEHVQQKLKQFSGDIPSQPGYSNGNLLGNQATRFPVNSPSSAGNIPATRFPGINFGQPIVGASPGSSDIGSLTPGFNTPIRPRTGKGSRGGRMPRPKGSSPRRGGGLRGKLQRSRGSKALPVNTDNFSLAKGGANSLFNHCENSPFVTGGGSIPNQSMQVRLPPSHQFSPSGAFNHHPPNGPLIHHPPNGQLNHHIPNGPLNHRQPNSPLHHLSITTSNTNENPRNVPNIDVRNDSIEITKSNNKEVNNIAETTVNFVNNSKLISNSDTSQLTSKTSEQSTAFMNDQVNTQNEVKCPDRTRIGDKLDTKVMNCLDKSEEPLHEGLLENHVVGGNLNGACKSPLINDVSICKLDSLNKHGSLNENDLLIEHISSDASSTTQKPEMKESVAHQSLINKPPNETFQGNVASLPLENNSQDLMNTNKKLTDRLEECLPTNNSKMVNGFGKLEEVYSTDLPERKLNGNCTHIEIEKITDQCDAVIKPKRIKCPSPTTNFSRLNGHGSEEDAIGKCDIEKENLVTSDRNDESEPLNKKLKFDKLQTIENSDHCTSISPSGNIQTASDQSNTYNSHCEDETGKYSEHLNNSEQNTHLQNCVNHDIQSTLSFTDSSKSDEMNDEKTGNHHSDLISDIISDNTTTETDTSRSEAHLDPILPETEQTSFETDLKSDKIPPVPFDSSHESRDESKIHKAENSLCNGQFDDQPIKITNYIKAPLSNDCNVETQIPSDEKMRESNLPQTGSTGESNVTSVKSTQESNLLEVESVKDDGAIKEKLLDAPSSECSENSARTEEKMEVDFIKEVNLNDDSAETLNEQKLNGLRLDLLTSNQELVRPVDSDSDKKERQTNFEDKQQLNDSIIRQKKEDVMQTFYCKWESCNLPHFKRASKLLAHMVQAHAPLDGKIGVCKVEGCKSGPRMKGALISHFQTEHCTYFNSSGVKSIVQITDKLLQKRDISPLPHEEESPVTRSVRYTAALILRNIAVNSPYGKSLIKMHEEKLALVAISRSEAANAISDCLAELLKPDNEDTFSEISESIDNLEDNCMEDSLISDVVEADDVHEFFTV